MQSDKKLRLAVGAGLLLCLTAVLLSLCLGSITISPADIVDILAGGGEGVSAGILRFSRLPRTCACVLAGIGLSVSGAVLQNVLSNKLASPSIIGVNAGAGLGVTLCCAAGALSGWAVSASAFAGSLMAIMVILMFTYRTGASKTTVILVGVAMNSMLNAFSESVTVLFPDVAALNMEFRVGGFSGVSSSRLTPAAVLIGGSLILLLTMLNELDIVTLGDEMAKSVGLSVKKYRVLLLVLAALMAGAAVSFAGLLGFVGLIVPHLIRRVFGGESRYLVPISALFGAAFVTLCDLAARLLFLPYELPVGIIMAVIGGPVFVMLLIRYKGGHRND
ncbi:MAG: iron ABC transporter permease [Clostridia bacterium]|nr:iron ABC transporter permease [Clostridia bacterium]